VDQHVPKNGLVNLTTAVFIFIATFAVTCFVNSLAGQGASIFLLVTVLIAFVSWFQMRLEENERLEKLELDELSRTRGESSLFETKDGELFPARRSREQFEKFFVPGFAVLLFVVEAGGAWLLWRWIGRATIPIFDLRITPSIGLLAIFGVVLFLIGRFSVTMARLADHRLLRPGSSFILAGAYVCLLVAIALVCIKTQWALRADVWLARAFCILLAFMAAEILLTLLLEIYRPRVRGKVSRPLYDSRLIGILAQPESLFTTAAQTLDYQFGFKVSETWFFKLLKENLPILILAQLAILVLSTCVVFVDAGEQAVLEHFGKPVDAFTAGVHFKWPWPADKVYRYRTAQIQSIYVGFEPDTTNEQRTILWTVAHNQEQNFLVATHMADTVTSDTTEEIGVSDQALKAPPVSLITVSIPIQFEITNVMQWAYHNTDATNLLSDLAYREVVHFLVGQDIDSVLSQGRLEAAQELQGRIQDDADAHDLGVKVLFVGLQDIHPPTPVAGDYEKVVGADQIRQATNLLAQAYAIMIESQAQAQAVTTTNAAAATSFQLVSAQYGRADLFTNQIAAYEAAPSVYRTRAYFAMFADATRSSRKYVLLVTNVQPNLYIDLQDKIRADLLNVNPE
jgi:regulator of protease activity HflC (stomatin/prohibitin superfamily)